MQYTGMETTTKPPISHARDRENGESSDGDPSLIQWHPAFVEAIQLELMAYKDSLEFLPEYQLTSGPLKIDCVIVKKAKGKALKKNIARIFSGTNILEYKGPDDYISVGDFYKVYGYACLLSSLEKTSVESMSISFITSRHPRKLLRHLTGTRGYRAIETSPGIHIIQGDIIPMQVIDSRRLSADDNTWLRGLDNRLDPVSALSLIKTCDKTLRQDSETRIHAYLYAIAKANFSAMEEAINMSSAAKSLDEVFERTGLAARWEAKAKAEAEAEAEDKRKAMEEIRTLIITRKLIDRGYPLEDIASDMELGIEKVNELYLEKQKSKKA